ncbi:cytochrome oxidase maturation protein, cbb3-type [Palleronia marisminoris]|uniref:Cytochrome oxidase maturation protein cbb3-type n=1 Tax=Palleronia marisminoris TaxID=315423 RepID=A0A1Y5S5J2_9RHOB|nr:cbb3-type cytochrome oxidase assembly protein CcoS [Palleronia marisminoris]SFG63875.1 cytochrome oxidase maturation protein, cbb3-type [Palleronia marisminoris]SLN32589.1 Cytochrome oxidase maturation protein cbb3-type [Palleronia marisminoris]
MSVLALLIPTSIIPGLIGLSAFLWSMRDGQYEDLDGSAERVLLDEEDRPLPSRTDESDER